MDRYLYTEVTQSNNNRNVRAYQSTGYPTIEPTETDIYIRAREGDRLDNLAYQYYEDAGLWWILALVNKLGKGSLVVPVSIQLRIPARESITNISTLLQAAANDD